MLVALLLACTGGAEEEDTKTPDKSSPPARTQEGADDGEGESGNQVGDNEESASVEAGFDTSTADVVNTLYVVNLSDYDVCWVYADSCDGAYVSDDLLGEDWLPYGYYLEVTGLPSDCWELYAYDCDGVASWYTYTTIDGEFTWFLTGSAGGDTGTYYYY
ncbi:MAG: hypothetical protein ACOZNI_13575 [Myxococcota bacterium]